MRREVSAPKHPRSRFVLARALFGVAVLTGCGSASLELPAEIEASPRLAVSGRLGLLNTQHLRFGDFTATVVEGTTTRGSGVGIGGFERSRRRQGYTLMVKGPGTRTLRTECNANVVAKGLNVGRTLGMDDRSSVRCDLREDSMVTGDLWKLVLEDDGKSPMSGALTLRTDSILVTGTNRIAGGAMPATVTAGYYFTRAGRTIAAVDVLNDGAVWLNASDAAERTRLAAVAAALLVAEDLRAPINP
jgi:hypothetical protein